ncbi:DUF3095 domain-containing protein [Motiliproteus sp. MSK22-1]|uniref:DUF3095 domain-containing protein n=1 Tax=Motiliproteus sp. MSK22-1 TaxID=1897630 RepID=UPI0009765CC1|nr:DUF3095 domain-containing protein [Motiliproteus sp. MSK22-1]OMH33292.1 hypothetical protein BGP75_13695 [Motiliproteus sp. MSK22-1]
MYGDIPSFCDFSEVTDRRHYHQLPDDWLVVIADIRGSTPAIAAGRYKDVNMMGAACITAVINIRGNWQIPYVFGGDGATMAVPPDLSDAACKALAGVRSIARQRFSLDLLIGMVPVRAIRQEGFEVRVAKFELSPGNYLATFSGGGVELAEGWVKSGEQFLVGDSSEPENADLEGLSCRWEPLKSQNGVILSMLVRATPDEQQQQIYQQVISQTADVMATDKEQGRPINKYNLRLSWPPRGIKAEIDATLGSHNRFIWTLRLYSVSLIQFVLDTFGIKAGDYQPRLYRQELRQNSDYRRFDDMLRILFDCTNKQADQIESALRELKQQGKITYGLHRTGRAIMTCLVFDLSQGEHIHFLDGDDGGFAMAAKQLKNDSAGK